MRKEERENLKMHLLNAVGKYSDYCRYCMQLSQLEEEYDETLELYGYAVWMGDSDGGIRDKAVHMLRVTLDLFEDMKDNARTELASVLKKIMRCSEEEQQQIWEETIFLDEKVLTDESVNELIWGWEDFAYDQTEALQSFTAYLAGRESRRIGEGIRQDDEDNGYLGNDD